MATPADAPGSDGPTPTDSTREPDEAGAQQGQTQQLQPSQQQQGQVQRQQPSEQGEEEQVQTQEAAEAAAAEAGEAPGQASPPLPQRHTPAAPGPRAQRFRQVYAQSLARTLSRVGWDNFAGCYPTAARRADAILRQVQTQMVDKLGDKCEKEFDNILASRHVVAKLNELEGLVGDAADRRTSADADAKTMPPHLLPPTTILSAHLHPALTAHASQLNARLQTTQSQNALLHDEVLRQRSEIDALLARLEGAAADLRSANEAMAREAGARDGGGAGMDGVVAEAEEGERILAAT